MIDFKSPKFILLTPLVLATTVAFANWGADSEETSIHNATANDEDRAAFIDLTKMVAAGDLEGRNAIVETNQKVLARKLKSEAWLDQRTIKVIERTAVPVIKVSTKDTRSRVLQLDLSFDAKEHHGLEALNMIQIILEVSKRIYAQVYLDETI